jgi:hypothetical protein
MIIIGRDWTISARRRTGDVEKTRDSAQEFAGPVERPIPKWKPGRKSRIPSAWSHRWDRGEDLGFPPSSAGSAHLLRHLTPASVVFLGSTPPSRQGSHPPPSCGRRNRRQPGPDPATRLRTFNPYQPIAPRLRHSGLTVVGPLPRGNLPGMTRPLDPGSAHCRSDDRLHTHCIRAGAKLCRSANLLL